jgi:hypothetical protein
MVGQQSKAHEQGYGRQEKYMKKISVILLTVLFPILGIAQQQSVLEFRVLQNNRLNMLFSDKLTILSDFEEERCSDFIANFGSRKVSNMVLEEATIRGQDYSETGVYLKIRVRDENNKLSTDGLINALKGKKIYWKKSPKPDEAMDFARTFNQRTIAEGIAAEDDAMTLSRGYLHIVLDNKDTPANNEKLVILLVLDDHTSYYLAIKQESTRLWLFEYQWFGLPALTFTNISSILTNEVTPIAAPIPILSATITFAGLYIGPLDLNIGLSLYGTLDVARMIPLVGQVFTPEVGSWAESVFPRCLYTGLLLRIEFDQVHYYVGAAVNFRPGWGFTNPLKPGDSNYNVHDRVSDDLIDFGVVIGVELLDFVQKIFKLPQ